MPKIGKTMNTNLEISHLHDQSKLIDVFRIYRSNTKTLGFLPKGAFSDAIRKKTLLVAKIRGQICGYLLYRVAKNRATIAHLCIATNFRGHGIARNFIKELKSTTAHLDGITLKCRNDFEIDHMWRNLGFLPKASTLGRGSDKAILTVWHIDYGHPDLLSLDTSKIKVVIDANIFLDLFKIDRKHHKVSTSLSSGWVEDVIDLYLTPEIYNDLKTKRETWQTKISSFQFVRPRHERMESILHSLQSTFSQAILKARELSDLKHLAYTIASGIKYFVTRDEGILSKGTLILDQYDLHILTPVEILSRLDWMEREEEYQPLRIPASSANTRRITATDLDETAKSFFLPNYEKLKSFKDSLEQILATPKNCSVEVCAGPLGENIALIATGWSDCGKTQIFELRHKTHSLAPTIIRHLLMRAIRFAISKDQSLITIAGCYFDHHSEAALKEIGFIKSDNTWHKVLQTGFKPRIHLKNEVKTFSDALEQLLKGDSDLVENYIWPGKLLDHNIPCYIIPIWSEWAEHFFDTDQANLRLPGLNDIRQDLHLGVEGVYYSSSSIAMQAPGRILWYVSKDSEGKGSMSIKACSRLREVTTGSAKDLYRRFRRLGVYNWGDIYKLSGHSNSKRLTALRFSHTEKFNKPLTVKDLKVLQLKSPFPGPRPISHELFVTAYNNAEPRVK